MRRSGWQDNPDYQISITDYAKPVHIILDGQVLAASQNVLLLSEQAHAPVLYFPRRDVNLDKLQTSTQVTFCPYKGEASHWSFASGSQRIDPAAWSYEQPFDEVRQIKGYIAFYPEVLRGLSDT